LLFGFLIGLVVALLGLIFFDPLVLIGTIDKNAYLLELTIYVIQKSAAEEFVFRLMLIDYLKKFKISNVILIIIQGVLFGLFHYLRYKDYILGVFFVVFVGLLMGVLRIKQRNIFGAIASHSTINLIFLLYWYL